VAPVAAILRALARAVRRGLGAFRSIQLNNLFLFVFLLAYGALESGVRPASTYPFLIVLGALLLFPLSSDPLARIPASRLGLWPLKPSQRAALRATSLALSPIVWFALVLVLKVRPSLTIAVVGIAAAGQAFSPGSTRMLKAPTAGPLRLLPALLRNHLRQIFSLLDTWLAILIAVSGAAWRLTASSPDPEAFPIFAMLVALALSTQTQCLFSLDGPGGITRYRLLPVPRWQILASKDLAWLGLLALLAAPLSLPAGLAFGLVALAIGHYPSLQLRLPLERRRFAGGRFIFGAAQMVVGSTLGFAAARRPWAYLPAAAALYAISLYTCRNMRQL
jgi:hypothetical protein